MSFYDEPFNLGDPMAVEVLDIARKILRGKQQAKDFISSLGTDIADSINDVDWDGAVNTVWPRALEFIAERGVMREFLVKAKDTGDFTLVRARIVEIIALCDEARSARRALGVGVPIDHTRATIIGRRPFVNRVTLRARLKDLFDVNSEKVLIVHGPPASGRSYTWVLIQHVVASVGRFRTELIDLSRFSDSQATPADVARMIVATVGLRPLDAEWDETAMDVTNARVLGAEMKLRLREMGKLCLVFDGLDGANLAEQALEFVGNIAAAAGNNELGECRVVLLAFNRALSNPNVDPFVPREPTLADLPLSDLLTFFKTIAAERGADLTDEQAKTFADAVFGSAAPDPVPMSLIRTKAAELSIAACNLRDQVLT